MASDLPDVREGDVWADNDPREQHKQRTVTIDRLCSSIDCKRPTTPRWPEDIPHAHVTASPSGQRTIIAIRRFKPNRSGYRLVSRKGGSDGE